MQLFGGQTKHAFNLRSFVQLFSSLKGKATQNLYILVTIALILGEKGQQCSQGLVPKGYEHATRAQQDG